MRMMFHPTCGNSTPSGRYLLEYLGQIHERSTLAPDSLIFNFARRGERRRPDHSMGRVLVGGSSLKSTINYPYVTNVYVLGLSHDKPVAVGKKSPF